MSVRANRRPQFTLHDLKDTIVSCAELWGTPATISSIRAVSGDRHAWDEDCTSNLTLGGFTVPSPHGLLFARFDHEALDQRRVALASLEAIAASRAIRHPERAAKYNFKAMLKPLALAVRQVNTLQSVRYATAILTCLFDIADLHELGELHRIQANEAMLYAWAMQLDYKSLPHLLETAASLLDAIAREDGAAAAIVPTLRTMTPIAPTQPPQRVAA